MTDSPDATMLAELRRLLAEPDQSSHLRPTCDRRGRKHSWIPTSHNHEICVECKAVRPSDEFVRNALLRRLAIAEERDALKREVEELRKREEWQPIETAPKDESLFIVFGPAPLSGEGPYLCRPRIDPGTRSPLQQR